MWLTGLYSEDQAEIIWIVWKRFWSSVFPFICQLLVTSHYQWVAANEMPWMRGRAKDSECWAAFRWNPLYNPFEHFPSTSLPTQRTSVVPLTKHCSSRTTHQALLRVPLRPLVVSLVRTVLEKTNRSGGAILGNHFHPESRMRKRTTYANNCEQSQWPG